MHDDEPYNAPREQVLDDLELEARPLRMGRMVGWDASPCPRTAPEHVDTMAGVSWDDWLAGENLLAR